MYKRYKFKQGVGGLLQTKTTIEFKNSTSGRIGGAYLACLKGVEFVWHLRLVPLNLNVPSGTLKELKLRFSFVSFKTLNRKLTFKACNPKNSDYIPYKYN